MLYVHLAIAWILMLIMGPAAAATTVHVGMLAVRPPADVERRWQPFVEHLNQKVPDFRFELRALGYADLEDAIARRTVDFVLTNPAHYVLMTYRNGLSSPLATLVARENGLALAKFGGVIFTRADRADLTSLESLRDRAVAAVSKGSLGGYQAQAMELLDHGMRIPEDIRLLETDMPQDRVVRAVLDGRADAGFVRTGVLEDMASEGKVDLARLKVLARKQATGFPLLLSTRLYPEWSFAAMRDVDEDVARQVAAALLALPHEGDLARKLDIHGFTIPTGYESVRATLEALRLPPFEAAPRFTLEDIWDRYRWQLAGGIALAMVIALLAAALVVLNRRLDKERGRIEQAAEEWRGLLTALGEGIYGVDGEGRCTFINPAALTMLGFSADEVVGRNQHELFHHHREDGATYPGPECPIFLTLQDRKTRIVDDWFWRKDGSGFPVTLTTAPMGEGGRQGGAVVVFRDLSERRQLERQLRKEATTDPLTGVANRRLFLERMHMELERFRRFAEPTVLLMADLDHFKRINDTYGHAAGDAVLRHFASLAGRSLRRIDLVGRLGGEEFGILLPGASASSAMHFAERFRRQVAEEPAITGNGPIAFSISIGVAEFDDDDVVADAILARADAALYQAKEGGRNAVALYEADAGEGALASVDRKSILRLTWRPRYASGEPTIDKQHRQLFRLANALLDRASAREADPEGFTGAFDTLLAHVAQHFSDEEAILRRYGYTGLDDHAESHRRLVQRALELRRQADEAGVSVGDLVDFLVTDVVAGHMLHEDLAFFGLFADVQDHWGIGAAS